ncbi:hypothetical protein I0C86_14060 [Plantactinospora sp. S1510]|uniref:Uncharacterized protein n=1 Tax=Plantactinospora alkalitolerans TaxID=2789879 RepID=A0ABS0GVP2_9ACTN|nr:hypothetical protein [Plantactinospora alkalitolerans]MBF9130051.1 hypothetical protein [Plantactinospora alkalitolerans]MBF9130073.1 hypothetical protein [Plantactinospora alkalitolerans]
MTIYQSRTTYQSRTSADADAEAAHATLAAHVPDRDSGICPACRTSGPCPPANAAANRLVDLGLPVLAPIPARRVPAMLVRITPLLTYAWQRRLGLLPTTGGG